MKSPMVTPALLTLVLVVSSFFAGCPREAGRGEKKVSESANDDDKSKSDGTEPNPSSEPTVGSPEGTFVKGGGDETIAACGSLGSGTDPCIWRWRADPAPCDGKRCDKLVIFFSGGQMSCPEPSDADSYLAGFESRGYVAACARLFETANASGAIPYNEEATRADLLIKAVLNHPKIKEAWSGKHLLISGVSHGATAPAIAMARTELDNGWTATGKVGACFLDGIYDIPALFTHLKAGNCAKLNSILSYERAYSRYCPFPENAILPRSWPEPSSCATAAVSADSISGVDPAEFAIRDWKLVECGSAMDPCRKDVVPGGPIEELCSGINSGNADHTCVFASEPQRSHIECGIAEVAVPQCGEWFDALVHP